MPAKVTLQLKSMTGSFYSQSRALDDKLKGLREKPEEFDTRMVMEKAWFNDEDQLIIPAQQILRSIQAACKKFGHQIPGKGKERFTKHFDSGIDVIDDLVPLNPATGKPYLRDEVETVRVHCDSNGKPNSGTRVWRLFPYIKAWEGEISFYVFDDTIDKSIFKLCVDEAGKFVGIGRWRPEKKGRYGKFHVTGMQWDVLDLPSTSPDDEDYAEAA